MDDPMIAALAEQKRLYERNRISLDALQLMMDGFRRAEESERRQEFERNCGNIEWMDRMARKQAKEELEKSGLHEVAKLIELTPAKPRRENATSDSSLIAWSDAIGLDQGLDQFFDLLLFALPVMILVFLVLLMLTVR